MPERPPTPVVLDITPFEFEEPSALSYYRRSSPQVIEETAGAVGLIDEPLVTTQDVSNIRFPFIGSSTASSTTNSREASEQDDGTNVAESTNPKYVSRGVDYFRPLKYVWNLAYQIGQLTIPVTSPKIASLSLEKSPLLGDVAPEPVVVEETLDNEDSSTDDSWYEVDELANKLADTSISEQAPIRLFPDQNIVEEPESYVKAKKVEDPTGYPTDSLTDSPVIVEQDRYHLSTSTRRGALVPPSTISSPYCPLANRSSAPSLGTDNIPPSSTSSPPAPFQEINYNTRRTLSLTSRPLSPRTTGNEFSLQSRPSLLRRLTSRKRKHSLSDDTDGYPPSTAYSSLSSGSSWGSQTTAEKSEQLCDRMITNSEAARRGRRLTKKSHKRARIEKSTKF
ncbi:MAG: hypothetical protein Q9167_007428 [Letrouitia subvulpina]